MRSPSKIIIMNPSTLYPFDEQASAVSCSRLFSECEISAHKTCKHFIYCAFFLNIYVRVSFYFIRKRDST